MHWRIDLFVRVTLDHSTCSLSRPRSRSAAFSENNDSNGAKLTAFRGLPSNQILHVHAKFGKKLEAERRRSFRKEHNCRIRAYARLAAAQSHD